MDVVDFRNIYWNYYMQMENDFFSFEPYCSIDKNNDNAFSTRYLQLLLSICGEIDTICKKLCKTINKDLNINNCGIDDYIRILNENYPTFCEEKVSLLNYKYKDLQPWQTIKHNHSPNWWKWYNKIKHHRDELTDSKLNYKKANQKNTIEALSALYILIQYWASKNFITEGKMSRETKDYKIMPSFKSNRFYMINWHFYFSFLGQSPYFDVNKFLKYIETND